MYIICSLCKRYTKDILFWNHYSIDIPGVYCPCRILFSQCPHVLTSLMTLQMSLLTT